MTPREVCHFWSIVGLGSFLWIGFIFGLGFVRILGGVLTYAPLVGVNYKVIGVDHSLFGGCLHFVDVAKWVEAVLGPYVFWSRLGPCWPTMCFESDWDHVG